MNQKINHYIDGLFERLPQSREAEELREELLANLNDRYEDELARGAGEEEAFQRAIESLGDLSEALGELPGAGPVYAAPPQAAAHRQNFLPWVLAALAFVALLLIAAMVFGFSSYRRALAGPPTQSVVSQALSAPAKLSDPAAAGTLEGPAAVQPGQGVVIPLMLDAQPLHGGGGHVLHQTHLGVGLPGGCLLYTSRCV